jgi:hypothetical protein
VAAREQAAPIGERAVESASCFTAPFVPDEEEAIGVVSSALMPVEVGDRALQPAEPRGAGAVRGGIFQCGTRGGKVLGPSPVEQSVGLDISPERRVLGLSGGGEQVHGLACFLRSAAVAADPEVRGFRYLGVSAGDLTAAARAAPWSRPSPRRYPLDGCCRAGLLAGLPERTAGVGRGEWALVVEFERGTNDRLRALRN